MLDGVRVGRLARVWAILGMSGDLPALVIAAGPEHPLRPIGRRGFSIAEQQAVDDRDDEQREQI